MAEMAEEYGLVCQTEPPYEVLGTKWLDYGRLLELKGVEAMVEVYYNSGQFTVTMRELEKEFETPFDLFLSLSDYYESHGLTAVSHSRMARYEILDRFVKERVLEAAGGSGKLEKYRRLLVCDLYLRENLKSRPAFAEDQEPYKERIRRFLHPRRKTLLPRGRIRGL